MAAEASLAVALPKGEASKASLKSSRVGRLPPETLDEYGTGPVLFSYTLDPMSLIQTTREKWQMADGMAPDMGGTNAGAKGAEMLSARRPASYRGEVVLATGRFHPSDLDWREAMQEELSLLARLKSPDVLSFVGIAASPGAAPTFDMDDDIEDREVFFLFEFAAGGDVYTLLRKDVRLGIRFRIQLARDAARAMTYLHSRGVIHRDLCTRNLVMTSTWQCKVFHFGSACRSNGHGDATVSFDDSSGSVGSSTYLAPELQEEQDGDESPVSWMHSGSKGGARGVKGNKQGRSEQAPWSRSHHWSAVDVYGFGVVLLELVTRQEHNMADFFGPESDRSAAEYDEVTSASGGGAGKSPTKNQTGKPQRKKPSSKKPASNSPGGKGSVKGKGKGGQEGIETTGVPGSAYQTMQRLLKVLPTECPVTVADLIGRCCAPDPDQRLTFPDILVWLDAILEALPDDVEAPPPMPPLPVLLKPPKNKGKRRRRRTSAPGGMGSPVGAVGSAGLRLRSPSQDSVDSVLTIDSTASSIRDVLPGTPVTPVNPSTPASGGLDLRKQVEARKERQRLEDLLKQQQDQGQGQDQDPDRRQEEEQEEMGRPQSSGGATSESDNADKAPRNLSKVPGSKADAAAMLAAAGLPVGGSGSSRGAKKEKVSSAVALAKAAQLQAAATDAAKGEAEGAGGGSSGSGGDGGGGGGGGGRQHGTPQVTRVQKIRRSSDPGVVKGLGAPGGAGRLGTPTGALRRRRLLGAKVEEFAMGGWLQKQAMASSFGLRTWNKRWFSLQGLRICWADSKDKIRKQAKGFDLTRCEVVSVVGDNSYEIVISRPPGKDGGRRELKVAARDGDEQRRWVECLTADIYSPRCRMCKVPVHLDASNLAMMVGCDVETAEYLEFDPVELHHMLQPIDVFCSSQCEVFLDAISGRGLDTAVSVRRGKVMLQPKLEGRATVLGVGDFPPDTRSTQSSERPLSSLLRRASGQLRAEPIPEASAEEEAQGVENSAEAMAAVAASSAVAAAAARRRAAAASEIRVSADGSSGSRVAARAATKAMTIGDVKTIKQWCNYLDRPDLAPIFASHSIKLRHIEVAGLSEEDLEFLGICRPEVASLLLQEAAELRAYHSPPTRDAPQASPLGLAAGRSS